MFTFGTSNFAPVTNFYKMIRFDNICYIVSGIYLFMRKTKKKLFYSFEKKILFYFSIVSIFDKNKKVIKERNSKKTFLRFLPFYNNPECRVFRLNMVQMTYCQFLNLYPKSIVPIHSCTDCNIFARSFGRIIRRLEVRNAPKENHRRQYFSTLVAVTIETIINVFYCFLFLYYVRIYFLSLLLWCELMRN